MAFGTVKFYKPERVEQQYHHPSCRPVWMPSVRSLFAAGDRAEFEYRPVQQDNFRFVVTGAQRVGNAVD